MAWARRRFAFGAVLIFSALAYQNCAPFGPVEDELTLSSTSEDEFPLQVKITQIAMNTCWAVDFLNKANTLSQISLVAGPTGGFRIRPEVLATLKANSAYQRNGVFQPLDAAKALASRTNSTYVQASFRNPLDLRGVAYPDNEYDQHYNTLYRRDLSTPDSLEPLIRAGSSYATHSLDGELQPLGLRLTPFFRQSLRSCDDKTCVDHEIDGETLRRNWDSGGSNAPLLTATFSNPGLFDVHRLLAHDDAKYGVGQGFRLGFKSKVRRWDAKNILSSVEEIDLEVRQPSGSWTCPSNLVLRVVQNNESCTNNDSHDLAPTLRRHLPKASWDINIDRGCVKPKGFNCYGWLPTTYSVVTSTSDSCSSVHPTEKKRCSHFVSVCQRQ